MFAASKTIFVVLMLALVGVSYEQGAGSPSVEGPEYTADAQLKLPEHYREWVYLTSDFYEPPDPTKMQAGDGQRSFNNILAEPSAYRAFLRTGTWPDKTMLLVDVRHAEDMGMSSSAQKGVVQSSQKGVAIHVKDEARFPGKWAFFGFSPGATTGKMIPITSSCYSCHAARGAEDTTFVQYYPTLLPIAESKNTLNTDYKSGHEAVPDAQKQ